MTFSISSTASNAALISSCANFKFASFIGVSPF
jgi:hypothetical protein